LKRRLIIVLFLALLFGVGTLVYLGQHSRRSAELYYSGTIEATQAELAFQVSGRVVRVLVDEGQEVGENQVVAELDRAEFLARRSKAKAELERIVQTVKQLETVAEIYRNTLPAEVERAEAAAEALKANLEELKAGYRTQEIERARLAFEAARITMEEARKNKDRYEKLFREGIVSEKEKDAVDVRYETALKEYERAKESLKLLEEGFRKESVEAARSKLAEGQAALREARSNLKKIEAAEREVEAAKAQVEAARANLELAEIQLAYAHLKAPFKGIITSRNVEPGEVVTPGREVISLADLSSVDLKVFVAETEIGKVIPGAMVEVKTDTFPDKTYMGRVSFISPEAEFTPKIIQTHKERVKLVYLVKISIPNPEMELKAGMPADAWFK